MGEDCDFLTQPLESVCVVGSIWGARLPTEGVLWYRDLYCLGISLFVSIQTTVLNWTVMVYSSSFFFLFFFLYICIYVTAHGFLQSEKPKRDPSPPRENVVPMKRMRTSWRVCTASTGHALSTYVAKSAVSMSGTTAAADGKLQRLRSLRCRDGVKCA